MNQRSILVAIVLISTACGVSEGEVVPYDEVDLPGIANRQPAIGADPVVVDDIGDDMGVDSDTDDIEWLQEYEQYGFTADFHWTSEYERYGFPKDPEVYNKVEWRQSCKTVSCDGIVSVSVNDEYIRCEWHNALFEGEYDRTVIIRWDKEYNVTYTDDGPDVENPETRQEDWCYRDPVHIVDRSDKEYVVEKNIEEFHRDGREYYGEDYYFYVMWPHEHQTPYPFHLNTDPGAPVRIAPPAEDTSGHP